jgi:tetratricopeptide (TPR) repeat protein/mono/diheme cytochrome c family protein
MKVHGRLSIGSAILSGIGITGLWSGAGASFNLRPAQSASRSPSVTFSKDIASILSEHCAPCHRPDRGAPFPLLTFLDAQRHAREIVEATGTRHMPPWLPRRGVTEFVGERGLTDAQIALIQRWVQQGAAEGDPDDSPPPPQWRSGWQLGEPDLVLEMPESYRLPVGESDVYRNFVLPTGIAERRFVRAIELRPDNPGIIHHAVVTIDRTRWSRYRDAQDLEPGYDGMLAGQAESPDGHFLAWTPGRMVVPDPDDMSWRLDRGADLVLQLHVMPSGRPQSVRVRIGLFFTNRPPTRVPVMLRIGPKDIDIAPGRRHYVAEDEYVLPIDVELLTVYPHAHYLARTMSAVARLPDGSVRSLLDVPRWDFHWQEEYRYKRPIALPRGTTLAMRYEYDNSAGDTQHPPHRVVYGPRSSDEMSDLWLQVLPHSARDHAVLKEALARRETLADITGYETLLRARPDEATTRTLLGSLYARAGRPADAEREFRRSLATAPGEWLPHYNLGAALQARGRVQEAESEYRAAVDLNPEAAEAYHARGLLRYGERRYSEAIAQFREAIAIWVDYADAYNSLGNALAKTGNGPDAIAAYRSALTIQPDHLAALNNLGILLASTDGLDEAIRLLQHAVAIAPTDADSRRNLAVAVAMQAKRARR